MANSKTKRKRRSDILLDQRRAVVEFGRTALRNPDLGEILTEACRHCGQAMATDLSKVMELQPESDELLVIAGIGWKKGVVGQERVPAIRRSSEGYALRTGNPAVSSDIEDEDRFDYAAFLKRHGVRAMVNVVIPGAEGKPPYGLLQVDSTEVREFSDEDVQFLQGYANILGAAIERHNYQKELAEAVRAKERALQELQHRVANNLALLGSMVRIKSRGVDNPVLTQYLTEILSQINVLSALHTKLYANSSETCVDLGGYLAGLCSGIASFASGEGRRFELSTHLAPTLVDADLAIPLGIVVNEFVTNSLKHGTVKGVCTIALAVGIDDRDLTVSISDEGPGLAETADSSEARSFGSGIGLIEGMLEQVGADWDWTSETGARLDIRLNLAARASVAASPA